MDYTHAQNRKKRLSVNFISDKISAMAYLYSIMQNRWDTFDLEDYNIYAFIFAYQMKLRELKGAI